MRNKTREAMNESLHLDALSEDDLFARTGIVVLDSSLGADSPDQEGGPLPGREDGGHGHQDPL